MRSPRPATNPGEPMAKPNRTLIDHTADVVLAFRSMFGTEGDPEKLAERWLAFFQLGEADLGPFLRNGLLCCRVHDWGKANTGFATMLFKTGFQSVRHEVISALILTHPSMWAWLNRIDGIDLPLVLAAVAGHHLKAAEPASGENPAEFGTIQRDSPEYFALTWDHPKVRAEVDALAREFGISGPIPEDIPRVWSVGRPRQGVADYKNEGRKRACQLLDRLREEIEDRPADPRARMLRALRSALIAADSAGSALFRTHDEAGGGGDVHDHIRNWIDEAFDPKERLDEARIWSAVIEPRIAETTGPGRTFAWNEFQEACADPARVPARALLLAPCGSGKTLAAWRWVAARCRERPIARAIFLYPTRGTATEGFRDYVGHAGPELAALVHGTAQLDLEHIRPDPGSEDRISQARLFSLQQWPKRVFSATVDQFLAFLQHDYGSTCLLPLLADSALVLDEVHSYDRGMFTALTKFLEHFDIPVLAMTATMLERRKTDLTPYLTEVNGLDFSRDDSRLRLIANHPRYEVSWVDGKDEARVAAETALRENLRVLWVVNRVDRAQELAFEFAEDFKAEHLATKSGAKLFVYHSRFKLRDRRVRHDEVVAAFKRTEGQERRAMLAIATQVCELSLDLDCDVLITEFAPVSALIQRFGRCCRDQEAHEKGRTGRVILYVPESNKPYTPDEMKDVPDFVGEIDGKVLSQSGLEGLLAAIGGSGFLCKAARFIDDGPWAAAGQDHFRDVEEYTCQAILPGDEDEYQSLDRHPTRYRAQELIVPILKDKDNVDSRNRPHWMPSWLQIAETNRHGYSSTLGYFKKPGGGHFIS